MGKTIKEYLEEHLNVYWLRPESALWDAVASYEIGSLNLGDVDIDLGSGNGIFSYITAGGKFTENFDWFSHADASNSKNNIFDNFNPSVNKDGFIKSRPDIKYRMAFDKKEVLLKQAELLSWYDEYIKGDIAKPYPIKSGSINTIFSNILYWIPNPGPAMIEIRRVLKDDGLFIACLPDPNFVNFCPTYKSHLAEFKWLHRLNRNRAKCIEKYFTFSDIKSLCAKYGFQIVHHKEYLSKELLSFWDIGLRPIIRPLLKMVGYLNEDEKLEVKREWIKQLKEDMVPVVQREIISGGRKGFHLCLLKKSHRNGIK